MDIEQNLQQTLLMVAKQNMRGHVEQVIVHTAIELLRMTKEGAEPLAISNFLVMQSDKTITHVEEYQKLLQRMKVKEETKDPE